MLPVYRQDVVAQYKGEHYFGKIEFYFGKALFLNFITNNKRTWKPDISQTRDQYEFCMLRTYQDDENLVYFFMLYFIFIGSKMEDL